MAARTPWQKTAEFVDGLKGKLPDWELAEIKRYVEKRCREEARAQVTAVTRDGTVQHCSPIPPNPDTPSHAYVKLENNEGTMGQELEELISSSVGTGLETPGQQGPPNEGTLEQRRTTANGFLTAGVDSSQGGRTPSTPERSTRTRTFADIFSIAATLSKRRLKTFNELNKPFDPGGREEEAPSWNAAYLYISFPGAKLGGFLSVCLSVAKLGGFLSVLSALYVFSRTFFFFSQVKLISKTFSRDADNADVRNRRTSVFSPTTLSEDGEDKQRPV